MFDNNGQDESQLSVSYGAKINLKKFFFNLIYTRAKDLELNEDNNKFVHSDGTEAIIGYRYHEDTNFMLGYNHQSRSESGQFDLLYYYASIAKTIKNFELAAEYIHGDSTNIDGSDNHEKLLKLGATLNF